jgi:acyl-CoA synthetase (AMP-forming)/AMP-acid ligase II
VAYASENISDIIFRYAEERPDAPALVEGHETLSYAAFAGLIAKATVYLADLGIVPGMRVAIAMANSIDHVVLIFGLYRIGATVVQIPSLSEPAYRAELVRKFRVAMVFIEPDRGALPVDVATVQVGLAWRRQIELLDGDRRHDDSDAVCGIILSSGSTSTPKGLVATHTWLRRHCTDETTMAVTRTVSPERPCPVLIPLSISYGGFNHALLTTLFFGSCAVILPKFAVQADMIRLVASWGDAVLPATPDICRVMAAHAPPSGTLLPKLRALVSMGQPLFADEKRAIVERVTPNLYDSYGAVGLSAMAFLSPHEMLSKGATVGRPTPGVEVEIVDADGARVPPGSLGRIRARRRGNALVFDGDPVPSGEGAEWLYPGEIGRFDADGYIVIKGRIADLVRRRGVEIFPPEIEEAIMAHQAVQDAAVVDRPLSGAAVELVAFVVKAGPLEHDDMVQHCQDTLPAEKRPNRIYYIDALPRLGTGKLDRVRLKALAEGRR